MLIKQKTQINAELDQKIIITPLQEADGVQQLQGTRLVVGQDVLMLIQLSGYQRANTNSKVNTYQ